MTTKRFISAQLFIALSAAALPLRADDLLEARLKRIEEMSPAEKAELFQKKKRFDDLTAQEQERIRKLHAEVEARSDRDELVNVMKIYHDWLRTLTTNQRAILRAKPDEEQRVAYIKQIVAEQQRAAWRKLAEQASPGDLDVVFNWLKEFVQRNQEKLAPGELGKRLAELDEDRQTLVLIHLMYAARFPGALRPGREDVEKLLENEDLSEDAKSFFKATEDPQRRYQLIAIWSRAAWWSKAFPNVTTEQLASFFEKLPAEERDRLELMPPAERDAELRLLYARVNFLRRGELGDHPWGRRGSRRGGSRGKDESSEGRKTDR